MRFLRSRGATITDRRSPSPHPAALVFLALALLAGDLLSSRPAAAETPAAAAGDPVVAEVVRLLEAGLGEPLIVRWIGESGKSPGPPTADDLVALKRAGASDQLIAQLLDRARAPQSPAAPAAAAPALAAPAPATPAPAPPAAVAPARAPSGDAAPSFRSATPPPSPPPPPPTAMPETAPAAAMVAGAASAATVVVRASLRYIHVPDEGEPWDLVVYLDGRPFEAVPAAPSAVSAGTFTGERVLAPGRHALAWSQELHRRDGAGNAQHAARFDPEPLIFELAAGPAAAIEFEYRDRAGLFLRMGGPVTVRVVQDGRELAQRNSSGDPAAWPKLCEEIEANLRGAKPGFLARQELRECLRWSDLWKSLAGAPGRDEVRPPLR